MNSCSFWVALLVSVLAGGQVQATPQPLEKVGSQLSPWRQGYLDIHHIATGRGNATFVRMPDGTSLLIDAGATLNKFDVSVKTRPNDTRRAGEWVARYIKRHVQPGGRAALDYLLVTHLHPDHFGDVDIYSPRTARGAYQLSGVTDVAEELPIGTVIDREYPSYATVKPLEKTAFVQNYLAFLDNRIQRGERVEAIRVGRNDQIKMLHGGAQAAGFEVRNVAANGDVWTGSGFDRSTLFPQSAELAKEDLPNENMASIALRIGYGAFAYFTAGDLTSDTFDGQQPWRDVLTRAAAVSGPVDVATADHHGMADSLNGDVVRSLRPRAWVISAWHLLHPNVLQLERMLSERLYLGERDVFLTSVMPETSLTNRRLMSRVRSAEGHVVIRVAPGGKSYQIVVTDNQSESDLVTWASGRYDARSQKATLTKCERSGRALN